MIGIGRASIGGDRVGGAAAERFAGEQEEIQNAARMAYTALTSIGVANLAGTADLFMGDDNGLNSGELPVNALLGAVPGLGGLAGAAIAARKDPTTSLVAGSLLDALKIIGDEEARREQGERLGDRTLNDLRQANKRMEQRLGRVNSDFDDYERTLQAKYPGVTEDQVKAAMLARSGRRLATGAAWGATLGALPAVMLMNDPKRQSVQQVAPAVGEVVQ